MRTYMGHLLSQDLDTLYRWLEDAQKELRFYKGTEEEQECQEHVDDILKAIDIKEEEKEKEEEEEYV